MYATETQTGVRQMNRFEVFYQNPDLSEIRIGFFTAKTAEEAREKAAEQEGGEGEPVTYYIAR